MSVSNATSRELAGGRIRQGKGGVRCERVIVVYNIYGNSYCRVRGRFLK